MVVTYFSCANCFELTNLLSISFQSLSYGFKKYPLHQHRMLCHQCVRLRGTENQLLELHLFVSTQVCNYSSIRKQASGLRVD